LIKTDAKIEFDDKQTLVLNGYPNELTQAMINILNNSLDNFEFKDTKNPAVRIEILDENEFINIAISDNGGGFDATNLPNLFEPFFTTKGDKKGTGLGLYLVKTIIEKVGGSVNAQNISGGARFELHLPKYDISIS
jgi:C4-dicarboxylate-specific signal transduction histidine kinase